MRGRTKNRQMAQLYLDGLGLQKQTVGSLVPLTSMDNRAQTRSVPWRMLYGRNMASRLLQLRGMQHLMNVRYALMGLEQPFLS